MSLSLSHSLFTSPFFALMYTQSHREAKEAEEEEKLTNSRKAEFQVSFTNWVSDARKIQLKEDKVCVCVCLCVCVCCDIFQMCAPCYVDSTGRTVCVCVCVCAYVCVCVSRCYNIFQMCAPCHADCAECTVCASVCVCACVSLCYLDFLYDFPVCPHIHTRWSRVPRSH